jgi:hypothetical protein
MIKRKGQHRNGVAPPSRHRMSDTEYAAYFEAFGTIKSDYQALCLIGDKLREVEATFRGLGAIDAQTQADPAAAPLSAGDKSAWEVCTPLLRLDRNEVLLCKRVCEHGLEYAVIDHSPVAAAYAKAHGPLDVLRTGDNPRQVLRDYLRHERQTLELMVNDITASVREVVKERFPKQDLRRVVNEIAQMCKEVARVGFSEAESELPGQAQRKTQGVRM